MSDEILYTYVRGKGWVPQPTNGPWYLAYHNGDYNWRNIKFAGFAYPSYEILNREYYLHLAYFSRHYPAWQFRIQTDYI